MAASGNPTTSGSRKVNASGWTQVGRRIPCTGGVAQNRTAGSTLYIPRRVALEFGSGIPGSMQTLSPCLSESNFGTGLNNRSTRLMAKNHWLSDDKGANSSVCIVVNVRATYTDCVKLDAHVSGAKRLFRGINRRKVSQRNLRSFFPAQVTSWIRHFRMHTASVTGAYHTIQLASHRGFQCDIRACMV